MVWWVTLLWYIGTFIVTELLRPKPNIENAKPATLGEFNFPTATEGRAIPICWGTNKIAGPNVVWYGDLYTVAIREKVKTGLWSSTRVIKRYEYYIGIQFALCRGPLTGSTDGLRRIWIDQNLVWDSGIPVEIPSPPAAGSPLYYTGNPVSDGTFRIYDPEFFGKDPGGIVGLLTVYPGTETQTVDPYLSTNITPARLPAFRGTAYAVWERGWVGNSPNVRPWAFEVTRIPNGLGLTGAAPTSPTLSPARDRVVINGLDANPMNVLFEIMTNTEWGLGVSSGDIDTASFVSAAETLAIEENGFSMVLDAAKQITEIINLIEQQVDGILLYDPVLDKYKFKLIRETDYPSPLSSLLLISTANAYEAQFSRGSWEETTNHVRVQFTDQTKGYVTSYAVAQDMANARIQGSTISSQESYPGVKSRDLANRIAWRDLRTLAYPLAKVTVKVNREAYDLEPGDLFRFVWPPAGINDEIYMRVNKVNVGDAVNGVITIDAVQDIFQTPLPGSFAAAPDTEWVEPVEAVFPIPQADQLIMESGRLIVSLTAQGGDVSSVDSYPRILSLVRDPNASANEYTLYLHKRDFPTAFPSTYDNFGIQSFFTPAGVLADALVGLDSTLPVQGIGSFKVSGIGSPPENLQLLVDAAALTREAIQNGATLAYIGDDDSGEFIAYTQRIAEASPNTGTNLVVSGVYRGLLDTPPKAHAAGTRVWFISDGLGISNTAVPAVSVDTDVKGKALPRTNSDSVSLTESPTPPDSNTIRLANRYESPQPITELNINGSRLPATVNADTNRGTASNPKIGFEFSYTRRDPRQSLVLSDIEGTSILGAVFTPASSGLEYGINWWIYDALASPQPVLRVDHILTGSTTVDTEDNDSFIILRDDIAAANGGVLPSSLRIEIEVTAKHEDGVTYTNVYPYIFDFAVTSVLIDGVALGDIAPNTWSTAVSLAGSPEHVNLRVEVEGIMNSWGGDYGGSLFYAIDGATSPLDDSRVELINGADFATSATFSVPASPVPTLRFKHFHYEGWDLRFTLYDNDTGEALASGYLKPTTVFASGTSTAGVPLNREGTYLGYFRDPTAFASSGSLYEVPSDGPGVFNVVQDYLDSATNLLQGTIGLTTVPLEPVVASPIDGTSYKEGVWYRYDQSARGGGIQFVRSNLGITVTTEHFPAVDPETGSQVSIAVDDVVGFAFNNIRITNPNRGYGFKISRSSPTVKSLARMMVWSGGGSDNITAEPIRSTSPSDIPAGTNTSPILFPVDPRTLSPQDVGHGNWTPQRTMRLWWKLNSAITQSPQAFIWLWVSSKGWVQLTDNAGLTANINGNLVPFAVAATDTVKVYHNFTAARTFQLYDFTAWVENDVPQVLAASAQLEP